MLPTLAYLLQDELIDKNEARNDMNKNYEEIIIIIQNMLKNEIYKQKCT